MRIRSHGRLAGFVFVLMWLAPAGAMGAPCVANTCTTAPPTACVGDTRTSWSAPGTCDDLTGSLAIRDLAMVMHTPDVAEPSGHQMREPLVVHAGSSELSLFARNVFQGDGRVGTQTHLRAWLRVNDGPWVAPSPASESYALRGAPGGPHEDEEYWLVVLDLSAVEPGDHIDYVLESSFNDRDTTWLYQSAAGQSARSGDEGTAKASPWSVTVQSSPGEIPTLYEWAIILLMLVMLVLGWRRLSHALPGVGTVLLGLLFVVLTSRVVFAANEPLYVPASWNDWAEAGANWGAASSSRDGGVWRLRVDAGEGGPTAFKVAADTGYAQVWSDATASCVVGTPCVLTAGDGGETSITLTGGKNTTVNLRPAAAELDVVFWQTDDAPVAIAGVSPPAGPVDPGAELNFTLTLSDSLPTDQYVYLRWSDDDWQSANVSPASCTGSSCEVGIQVSEDPGAANVLRFYGFVSAADPTRFIGAGALDPTLATLSARRFDCEYPVGSSQACPDGEYCSAGLCLTPTCVDELANGNETGVDCGGDACPACADGHGCDTFIDCLSQVCSGSVCLAPSCFDAVENGDETGVDSGGSCGAGIPPDPTSVAPALDETVPTAMAASVAFLYTGDSPSQTGLADGAVDAARVAVLRGSVFDRDGDALPGVTISALNQPTLGTTRSRADGGFELVVNGGARILVNYELDGYLAVQRRVSVGWEAYAQVPDAWMSPLDSASTEIDLGGTSAVQVAQGSVVTDDDGSRQATILFAAGTTGNMVLADGSSQVLDAATVRVTEFTVGDNGPERMPASLPPATLYTWAAEFSVDEAQAAGATTVTFDPPVVTYIDNFLGFDVGGVVPTGYYDRGAGVWVPSTNGRVVGVVSITDGLSDLDVDGDDIADSGVALSALGITDVERAELAGRFSAGQSFWRVPMSHFTPYDCNWNGGPPEDARGPGQDKADQHDDDDGVRDCDGEGSVIGCYRRTLGEDIAITGTPYSLHYRSHRCPGYKENTVEIPLTDDGIPDSLLSVLLEFEVAGQALSYTYDPLPNQVQEITWDGLDAYGRSVSGRETATVRIGYVYQAQYYDNGSELEESFGQYGANVTTVPSREEVTIWQEYEVMMGNWDARVVGLGGWTLGAQHVYDADDGVVHLGTGQTLTLSGSSTNAAGLGHGLPDCYYSSETNGAYQDGSALASEVCLRAKAAAVGPDGSLYLSTGRRIQKITPDGRIRTVAMHSLDYIEVYGEVPPVDVLTVDSAWGIAVDADGGIYYGDHGDWSIRYVSPEGLISIVAGGGDDPVYEWEDGEEATAHRIHSSRALAVGPDGSLYVADKGATTGRVFRISPAGRIYTFAGGGSLTWDLADGAAATEVWLNDPEGLAIADDGTVYVSERGGHRIRRVDTDGSIHTIAGKSNPGMTGDGGPAVDAKLNNPSGLALAADGSLYVHDAQKNFIRRISAGGIISRIAGDGTEDEYPGDGTPPLQVPVDGYGPTLAMSPAGTLYLPMDYRVLAIGDGEPLVDPDGALLIPSSDGQELYRFDEDGRHQQTLDSLTGRVIVDLGYDSDGRLITLTDDAARITTIVRDSAGTPTAIEDSYGVSTGLVVNGAGYLEDVSNPANETHEMRYSVDGLLTSFTRPSGHATGFTYDSDGRLEVDLDPAGGSKTLARSEDADGYEVTVTTGEGGVTTHRQQVASDDALTRIETDPNGLSATLVKGPDGTRVVTYADGSSITVGLGPDPRFFMSAPIVESLSVRMPSGLTSVTSRSRTVTLSDSSDVLSLATLVDSTDVNGDVTTTAWDGDARTLTVTRPSGLTTVMSVDTDGRVTNVAPEGLDATSLGYDGDGRLTGMSRGDQSLVLTYDSDGRVQSVTDALSRSSTYTYGPAGRVTTLTQPDGRAVGFGYDDDGNLTTVTPPARPDYDFTFSPVDLETSYTTPAVGGVSVVSTRSYDLDRRLTGVTRPDGAAVTATYDAGGRLSTLTAPSEALTYGYHPTGGQLTGITGADAELSFSYDGLLRTSETWSGGVTAAVTYGYNSDLALSSVQVGTEPAISLTYDGDDRLVTAGALSLSYSETHGLLSGTSLGTVSTSVGFDAMGALASEGAVAGASAMYDATLTRDALGRLDTRVEVVDGVTTTTSYGYDDAGRLVSVTVNGVSDGVYGYDDNGNRTSAVTPGGSAAGVYDDQDRVSSYGTRTYTYTDNGEIATMSDAATGDGTSYTYDVFGNLRSVTLPDGRAITYLYDASQRRVAKEVDGVRERAFIYLDGFRPLAELDASGAITSLFVYGSRQHVPDYLIKGGRTYRVLTDHLGSPRRVVDAATGVVEQEIVYDAWGRVQSDSNPGFQPFGFAGGLVDADTDLILFGWRNYDPVCGRWTSRDPIAFAGGDANHYAYVHNDPVNLIDPQGLQTSQIGLSLGGALLGLSGSIGVGVVVGFNETNGDEDWGLYLSLGSGAGSPAELSLSLDATYSGNDCIDDIEGDAFSVGGSVGGGVSGGYELGNLGGGAEPTHTASIGAGAGVNAYGHATKTWAWH